jgi:5-methylcytosine-specific restriction endonuclease McrA
MNAKPNTKCHVCEKPLYRSPSNFPKSGIAYCRDCVDYKMLATEKNDKLYEDFIIRWKSGNEEGMRGKTSISAHIRRYLFERAENKCEICGWSEVNQYTGKIPLEVNHKDGNFKNNIEENLELLCPNCHSLTENFKSRNFGRGRPR